jgi:SHS2 domain-containing protein
MIILQDTKEKLPWSFARYDYCDEQKPTHLEEGDYTIEEYPDLVVIERKHSVAELASNLGLKYVQFVNEMERLKKYRFRYVVCEFSESEVINYPHTSKLPRAVKAKIKMSGKFLMKRIRELTDKYDIRFIFCGTRDAAQRKAMELLIDAEATYQQETISSERSGGTD